MFPTFQSPAKGSTEDPTRPSNWAGSGPTLDNSIMVPNSSQDVVRPAIHPDTPPQAAHTTSTPRASSSLGLSSGSSSVAFIRSSIKGQGLSDAATNIIMSSWRKSTSSQYATYLQRWQTYCAEQHTSPTNPSVGEVLDTSLYHNGLGYSAINTAKSALSSCVNIPGHTMPLGNHPLVVRFMKGVFELKPSLPRYTTTWDIKIVLDFLAATDTKTLSLKSLSHKLATLLSLLTGQRLQTLAAMKVSNLVIKDNIIIFYIDSLLKTSKQSAHIKPIQLTSYDKCTNICIVRCVKHYLDITNSHRTDDHLLLSYIKPHKAVGPETISRWIKSTLFEAGIDVSVFAAHSTRSAATSAGTRVGVPLDSILQAGNWCSAKTFALFYNKPLINHLKKME